MKTKHIVKSLWIDPVIGNLQILCLQSFLIRGIEVHLYTYNDIENVPEGVLVYDANKVIEYSAVFKDNRGSYATFSDWFRIKLLHDTGGWWVDCDVFCLQPFDFDEPYVFATEAFNDSRGKKSINICNAVIKMPKDSDIGKKILSDIEDRLHKGSPEGIFWTEIGARILTKNIISFGLFDYVMIPEVFCPNDYQDYNELVENENLSFGDSTYGVHLWNKMWEWNNKEPLKLLKKESFLGRMMTDNGV